MITRPKSTNPSRRNGKKLSRENNEKINQNENNITFYQSPKISSGKLRSILNNSNKIFSILDLNEKAINKGTSLPIQFKRLTQEEIQKIFHFQKLETYKKMKKKKISSMRNILFNKLNIPQSTKSENKNLKIDFKQKEISEKNYNDKISSLTIEKDDNRIKKEKIKIKRPQSCKVNRKKINFKKIEFNPKTSEENEKTLTKNDIWKPINYDIYEEMVKNRTVFINKMQENPFFARLPQSSIKEIKSKGHNSDIFFLKKNEEEKCDLKKQINNMRQEKYNIYFNSDIFNIKNDEISLNKIGEKYLFNNPNNIKYTSSRESKSDWHHNSNKDTSNNFSSKNYNILTPNRKNNSLTKDDIYKILKENKAYNNPLNRHTSISKFMDLAHSASSNFGKEYLKFYNSNPNCFKKIAENCGSYGDLYLHYKNLYDEPFYKKKNYN